MPNTDVSPNMFDRGKPFYPLIMNYVIQLAGWKELAARAFAGASDVKHLFNKQTRPQPLSKKEQTSIAEMSSNLCKLLGPLELRSEYGDNHISVDIDALARELVSNHSYLISFHMLAAGSVLILAHEICQDKPYHDEGALWEFLRHCRNAAAHGGIFAFQGCEPRHDAAWGRYIIKRPLQGTLLFKDVDGVGLLSPGDPIRLLWDIEQAYPAMQ